MGGVQWMVVLIVAIVMISKLVSRGMRHEERRAELAASNPEADRLRDEVAALKDRLAVLERIATDSGSQLDREIEALRGPDDRRLAALREHDAVFRRNHADTREG